MRIAVLAVEPFKVCGLVSDRRRALRPLEGDGSWGHPCSLGAGMVAINIGLWEVVSLEQKGLFECL
jgi:hypothetical protein